MSSGSFARSIGGAGFTHSGTAAYFGVSSAQAVPTLAATASETTKLLNMLRPRAT
ncbi:hypothetical protein GCM10009106_04360 [Sphingomonas japonica]